MEKASLEGDHHIPLTSSQLGFMSSPLQSVIIKRNQPLPTKGGREYTTIADNQMQVIWAKMTPAHICVDTSPFSSPKEEITLD